MKNGAETNVWARITAIVVNGTEKPEHLERRREQAAPPEDEQQREPGDRRRQDDREVDDRLEPALAAELPTGQDERERQAERDRDDRLIAVVTRLSHSASRTTGEATASPSDPSRIARTTSVTTGSPRNRAKSAATATSERSPQRPGRAPRPLERPSAAGLPPGRPAASSITTGGRKPKPLRIAWPSGPANQSRKALAAAAFFDALTTTPA